MNRGFTLFEVILSLLILSLSLGVVTRLFVDDNQYLYYSQLVNMENDFLENGKIESKELIKFK